MWRSFLSSVFFLLFPLAIAAKDNDMPLPGNLSWYLIPMFRYEDPINRDHFYYPETGNTSTNWTSSFNFADYRFDGFVGNVLSTLGYSVWYKGRPEADNLLPIYHGYDDKLKHNYYSKPYEPRSEPDVKFYLSKKKGFHMADHPLYTLDGQPIDFFGDLGYDTIYTTNLSLHLLPPFENYVMYRVLGYSWDFGEVQNTSRHLHRFHMKLRKPAAAAKEQQVNPTEDPGIMNPFIHSWYHQCTPLFQFFEEHDQNYYYKLTMDQTLGSRDRTNFVDVVAYIVKQESASDFADGCTSVNNTLIPLISAYANSSIFSTTVLFLSEATYQKAQTDMKITFINKTTLGYVGVNASDCYPRYQLNIYRSWNDSMLSNPSEAKMQEQYVYIAPVAAKDTHELFYNQFFWLW